MKLTGYMERKGSSKNDASGNGRAQKRNTPSPNAASSPETPSTEGTLMPQAQTSSLSSEEIAARAYEIYERDGRADGRDMEHWLRAEAELRGERENSASTRSTEDHGTSGNPQNPQNAQNTPRSARRHQAGAAM